MLLVQHAVSQFITPSADTQLLQMLRAEFVTFLGVPALQLSAFADV